MLPNLLTIGAAKAGTTSLHYYLGLHPQIEMSATKELRFFSHDAQWMLGQGWYESQFTSDAPVRGESSPSYTQYRRFPEVPRRVKRLLPDARFIYLVRDPMERLVSHYTFSVARGRERGSPSEALLADGNRYVDCSLYYAQIARYLEHFDRSRILILSSEDLQQRTADTLDAGFRFLGVDEAFRSLEFRRRFNEVTDHCLKTPTGLRLEALNRLRIVEAIPRSWRMAAGRHLYRPFSRPASKPRLDESLRRALVDRLQDDVNRFRAWSGQRFDAWSV